MGLFLIVGHWLKILPQNSKGPSYMCVLCTFSPLLLKSVPDWPAITSVVDNSKVSGKLFGLAGCLLFHS
jgi:hypothetical protein